MSCGGMKVLACAALANLLTACAVNTTTQDASSADADWIVTLDPDARASDRIVRGERATTAQWPAFAALRVREASDQALYFCGGTFIAPDWILTAAHCFDNDLIKATGGWKVAPKSPVEVVGGTDDLEATVAAQVFAVRRILVHPDYVPMSDVEESLPRNDVALVNIRRNAGGLWNGTVAQLSAQAPSDADVRAARAFVAGFGNVRASSDARADMDVFTARSERLTLEAGSRYLKHTMVPMKPSAYCEPKYNFVAFDGKTQICAGHQEGRTDSCVNDSGGPLMALDTKSRAYQVGIVSAGFGCATAKFEGAYTRVSAFRTWITGIVPAARFVSANPEEAVVASHEMMTALTKRIPVAQNQELTIKVGRRPAGTGATLTIDVTVNKSGRLLIIEHDTRSGDFKYLYPNSKTPPQDYVLPAGSRRKVPALDLAFRPSPNGATIYAFLLPDSVKFAGDLMPTPEIERTVPESKRAERDQITFADRLLNEIATRSGPDGLNGWYGVKETYPAAAP